MVEKIKRFPYLSLLKVLIGVALLILSFWEIDWVQLKSSISQINLIWLMGVAGLVLLGLMGKVVRWFIFVRQYQIDLSFGRVLEAFFLDEAANILLPFRGGELVRLGYVSSDRPEEIPQITTTIILEKLFDLIALTCTALIVND